AEGRAVAQRRRIAPDRLRLLRAPGRQRRGEARICDMVPAAHEAGQEAARQLVLALRTGLECDQALAQAVVDALVVAGLEVQAGQRLVQRAAPVAPVQGVATAQAQR